MRNRFRKHFRQLSLWLVIFSVVLPLPSAIAKKGGNHKAQVKVMTRNLYLGADIFRVVIAAQSPNPIVAVPEAVAEVFSIMQKTNFNDRAEAIADEVLKTKPHVIGIQEASTYYFQTPSQPDPAEEMFIDFYLTLDAALRARGLYYDAYAVKNADIEMPMVDGDSINGYSDVRLVDRDMILVKKSLKSSAVIAGNYSNNLGLDIAGNFVEFTRGYLVVDVKIKRETYRIVNTHLEIRSAPGSVFRVYQDAQMLELLGIMDFLSLSGSKQVVMVGDFNSSPDDIPGFYDPAPGLVEPIPYVPPYMRATDAGYMDAWLLQKKYDEGFTSGFNEFVDDPSAELTTRIDHIFLGPDVCKIEKVKAIVVGDEVKDMTPNGLWPSDHAGVVAKIKFSKKHK